MRRAECFVKYNRSSTRGSGPRGFFGIIGQYLEIRRREAEALIKPKEADEAVENECRTDDKPTTSN